MWRPVVAGTCLSVSLLLGSTRAHFTPALIPLEDLVSGHAEVLETLRSALTKEGIVQVSAVPNFAVTREEVLRSAVECAGTVSREGHPGSVFPDGTVRLTFAGLTSNGVNQPLLGLSERSSSPCREFKHASNNLRGLIDEVSQHFVQALDDILHSDSAAPEPFLKSNDPTRDSFFTLDSIVRAGDQLEHFHLYSRSADSIPTEDAIAMHTDQGLFIAFVPALLFTPPAASQSVDTGLFTVELRDGSVEDVAFSNDGNVVTFMLGDGVNQFMNTIALEKFGIELRATPHALRMPRMLPGSVRSWYGRMFLAPSSALHREHQVSYGELRAAAVQASSVGLAQSPALTLGCSHDLYARELASAACAEDQIYCWHRCMNYTTEANPEICQAQNLTFVCKTPSGQVWQPETGHSPGYQPGCVSDPTDFAPAPPTPAPTFPSTCEQLGEALREEIIVFFSDDGEDDHDHDHRTLYEVVVDSDAKFDSVICDSESLRVALHDQVLDMPLATFEIDTCGASHNATDDDHMHHSRVPHNSTGGACFRTVCNSGQLLIAHYDKCCSEVADNEHAHHTCEAEPLLVSADDSSGPSESAILSAPATLLVVLGSLLVILE